MRVPTIRDESIASRERLGNDLRSCLHGIAITQCRQSEAIVSVRFSRRPIERQWFVASAFADHLADKRMQREIVTHLKFLLVKSAALLDPTSARSRESRAGHPQSRRARLKGIRQPAWQRAG